MADHRSRLSAFLVAVAMAVLLPGTASSAAACNRFAGPSGSGRIVDESFGTVQRLVSSLRPGQTGCLRAGTYQGDLRFPHGGRAGAPITLKSVPGERATIVGRIWIPMGSDHVRITGLHLDGRNDANLPSPSVNSAYDQFVNDDVTNDHTAICFELGSDGQWGRARRTLIEHNRIHDCGVLPATNHQHGVYVANSIGARIVANVIYNNADRGIQLYWNAQRTTIIGNIIDHNGEGIIISGGDGFASSNNLITNNVITNSRVRADVASWWPDGSAKGRGNLVSRNCVYGGRWTIDLRAGGFAARDNVRVNPRYADFSANDHRLMPGSPCRRVLAGAISRAAGVRSPRNRRRGRRDRF